LHNTNVIKRKGVLIGDMVILRNAGELAGRWRWPAMVMRQLGRSTSSSPVLRTWGFTG
jgi:hypothetical protein